MKLLVDGSRTYIPMIWKKIPGTWKNCLKIRMWQIQTSEHSQRAGKSAGSVFLPTRSGDEEEDRLVRIIGAVQDVTLQKQSEEMLKETLLQQAAILNSIPDMAWLKNKNSRYVAVNEQFTKTAGKKIEEILGKTDLEIWDREFAEIYRKDDLEVMQSRQRKPWKNSKWTAWVEDTGWKL